MQLMKSKRINLSLTFKQADLLVRALELHVTGVESDLDTCTDNEDTGGILNAVRGAERVAYQQERARSWSLIKVINKRASKLFPNW